MKTTPQPQQRKHRTKLTRKEIAYLIDETVAVVRYNEKLWGLDKHKVKISHSNVSYWEDSTMEILRARGLLRPYAGTTGKLN